MMGETKHADPYAECVAAKRALRTARTRPCLVYARWAVADAIERLLDHEEEHEGNTIAAERWTQRIEWLQDTFTDRENLMRSAHHA